MIKEISEWLHDGDFTNPNPEPVWICVNNEPRLIGPNATAPREWDVDGVMWPDGSATKIWGASGYWESKDAGWIRDNWPACAEVYGVSEYDGGDEGGGCVDGDTIIGIGHQDGARVAPIRNIEHNAPVDVYDFGRKAISSGWTVRRFVARKRFVLSITYNLLSEERVLRVTPTHRVYSTNGWIPAGFLYPTRQILCADANGKLVAATVKSIVHDEQPVDVFNLSVYPWRVYFANGVLVHNKKKEGDYEPTGDKWG